ncbi:MAG: T9SS type A sorting domain-containing protein [Crocinitomicaceae bacterium]
MDTVLRLISISVLLSITTVVTGQGINGYGEVTGIAGTTITLANVSEADDTFEDGEFIIIMQVQDDVIGTTTNTASFGDLGTIESAGLYEIKEILSHTEASGLPATITVASSLTNTYNLGVNSSVQIISFPSFGSPNYTTTANMSPPSWNGSIGGVLAFEVPGVLTLAHNIDANADGFRGGANDASNTTTPAGTCTSNIFITTDAGHAFKGEGIYKSTVASHSQARAKILNGGGGGSGHNGGGAGGGNYSEGGVGGRGFSCRNSAPQSIGGQGGISLLSEISSTRFFLGGGGGSGEQNNSAVTTGGAGGGIIIIKADEITTSGACGVLSISSNGATMPDIGNDGAPGGGAGGTIFFDVNTFSIGSGCTLDVDANGGNGGTAITGTPHAGGGGGGQGVVIYTIPEPTTNIVTSTNSGTGGCDNNANPCTSVAGTGSGAPDDGIIPSSPSGPLPVSLTFFKASKTEAEEVLLQWETKSELNNDFFVIEKSVDGENWQFLAKIEGAGNSSDVNSYQTFDRVPMFGVNYYRLSQIDFDGALSIKGLESVFIENKNNNVFTVFPNPSKGIVFVESSSGDNIKSIRIQNMMGQEIAANTYWVNGMTEINMSSFEKGVYLINIVGDKGSVEKQKVVLK